MEVGGGAALAAARGEVTLGLAADSGLQASAGSAFSVAVGTGVLVQVDAQDGGHEGHESDQSEEELGLVEEHVDGITGLVKSWLSE